MTWTSSHEVQLAHVQQEMKALEASRREALQTVARVLSTAGCDDFDPERVAQFATDIRAALAPFDKSMPTPSENNA